MLLEEVLNMILESSVSLQVNIEVHGAEGIFFESLWD